MKNSEIFYFDIDGTLLDNATHSVPESTIKSLQLLKDKGYHVAICTGRNLQGATEANVMDLIEWDGYVLANGSLVLDRNRKTLFESTFSNEFITRLDNATKGPLLLEGKETFATKLANEALTQAIDHYGLDHNLTIKKHTDEIVYNMMSYSFDDFEGEVLKEINETCLTMHDLLGNMEIIPGNSGKHFGTTFLNKHLNLSRFTGFGDGENDVEFLREATYSVAMGNGVDNVKAVSTFITKNVDEDGIYHALVHHKVL